MKETPTDKERILKQLQEMAQNAKAFEYPKFFDVAQPVANQTAATEEELALIQSFRERRLI